MERNKHRHHEVWLKKKWATSTKYQLMAVEMDKVEAIMAADKDKNNNNNNNKNNSNHQNYQSCVDSVKLY